MPENYYQTYDKAVKSLTLQDLQKVAKQVVSADKLTWFVVGDKEKVMSGLKELGFAEIIEIDPNGNPIKLAPQKLKTND